MKCVAIGDMFVSEKAFAKVLKNSDLFDSYEGFSWKEDLDRVKTRSLIRKIETEGSRAYELPSEIQNAIMDTDVLFMHMAPVNGDLIANSKNLKYIISARGGVENIDIDAAKQKGITVIHCPMHNAHGVAELTLGLMICESRNISRADTALKNGVWREKYPNSGEIKEIRSCKIGIIGFGTIGQLVADLLKPFHCEIYVSDPFVDSKIIENKGCIPLSKEELLSKCDIVTLHGRIGPNDPPIIGERELELMSEKSYLINTARAVLVDMKALTKALKEKKIRGAAIDVFPKEPLDPDDEIMKLDNCTLTNHRGGDTIDSYERSPEIMIEQLREVLMTGKTKYMIR
ncbi:2-hydroxyacid dehydrogenase [Absicoccus intestinalis]|uniref:2-hydroxyacid dehydrogenase n=1 Tax=Absicoccus intestinalis TaxID=2926319 RepID=A0ABU4WNK2_9FIRM|nr:2-hydroxyacid dehydrogenase [Absicoccus sp. CLA-KB-P134]MDX8418140.1 2-hydroxyacid dehydrogenase [Absicoccus sp. CLA-KB-P134]